MVIIWYNIKLFRFFCVFFSSYWFIFCSIVLFLSLLQDLNFFFNSDFSFLMLSTFRNIGRACFSSPRMPIRSGKALIGRASSQDFTIKRHMTCTFDWVKFGAMPKPHVGVICDGWDTSGDTIITLLDGTQQIISTSEISDDIKAGKYWCVTMTKNPAFNGVRGVFLGYDKKGTPRFLSDKGQPLSESLFKSFKNPGTYTPKATGLNAARQLLLIKNENFMLIHSHRVTEFIKNNPGSYITSTTVKWATVDKTIVPTTVTKNWDPNNKSVDFYNIFDFLKKL